MGSYKQQQMEDKQIYTKDKDTYTYKYVTVTVIVKILQSYCQASISYLIRIYVDILFLEYLLYIM